METPHYEVTNANGDPIEITPRIRAFVERYVERWKKKHNGALPRHQHPFPNPWDYTFIVDFEGREPGNQA